TQGVNSMIEQLSGQLEIIINSCDSVVSIINTSLSVSNVNLTLSGTVDLMGSFTLRPSSSFAQEITQGGPSFTNATMTITKIPNLSNHKCAKNRNTEYMI